MTRRPPLLARFECRKRTQQYPVLREELTSDDRGAMSASDPGTDIIGERIETSLLSPGFHLGASCFLPAAAWA